MATWKKIITSGSNASLASLTLDTDLAVAHGGTGQGSYTDGQLLIGNTSGNTLAKATLTGTSNEITVTNGNGSITLSQPDDVTIGQDLTVTRNISNASAVGDSHLTGSFSGSFVGDGSNLTGVAQDIDSLGAGSDIVAADKFLYSNGGTEQSVTFGIISSSIFENISGDITIAAGGVSTIGTDTVANSMLENMTRGTVKVGGNSNAPTDLDAKTDGQILVGDGSDIASVAVSGDVTLASDGAVTIANDTIGNAELKQNDAITLQSLTLTGDLTVNGSTTTVSSTNVTVGDQLMFLATGSQGSNKDSGIIAQSGSATLTGSALYHDTDSERWSVAKTVASTATSVSPLQHVVTVRTHNDSPADGEYGVGEMHIDLNEDDGAGAGTIYIRTS